MVNSSEIFTEEKDVVMHIAVLIDSSSISDSFTNSIMFDTDF